MQRTASYRYIKKVAFIDLKKLNAKRKPLMLGCSGGGGHNSSIAAIREYLIENNVIAQNCFPTHLPALLNEKPILSRQKLKVKAGVTVGEISRHVNLIEDILKRAHVPILPGEDAMQAEMEILQQGQLINNQEKKPRYYVDMLLDVYKTGYQNAAIWNILLKLDKVEELKKLVELQAQSDNDNYHEVKHYFIAMLKKAAKDAEPYTEIISTQAMALPALCDAVRYYNHYIAKKYQASEIKIHQYMTDLPTEGAFHFFNPLKSLTRTQRKQMYLYGVGLDYKILNEFQLGAFAGFFSIDEHDNPMVRRAFRDEGLIKYLDRSVEHQIKIQIKNEPDKIISIKPDEKIAAVMLGSQASQDTVEYAKQLIEKGYKVFVFGGKAPHLKNEIEILVEHAPELIIPLDNQGAEYIAPVMVLSDIVIMRGGGLSIMEQMALRHHSLQKIFIHSKEIDGELTSGVDWEDKNVVTFKRKMKFDFKVSVKRTTTKIYYDLLNGIVKNEEVTISNRKIIKTKDQKMVLLNKIVMTSGSKDDPFNLFKHPIDARINFNTVSKIPIVTIFNYIIANPAEVDKFIKRIYGVDFFGKRNFRKQIIQTNNGEYLRRLIGEHNDTIRGALRDHKILNSRHINPEPGQAAFIDAILRDLVNEKNQHPERLPGESFQSWGIRDEELEKYCINHVVEAINRCYELGNQSIVSHKIISILNSNKVMLDPEFKLFMSGSDIKLKR
jgi:hypothetical protein